MSYVVLDIGIILEPAVSHISQVQVFYSFREGLYIHKFNCTLHVFDAKLAPTVKAEIGGFRCFLSVFCGFLSTTAHASFNVMGKGKINTNVLILQ